MGTGGWLGVVSSLSSVSSMLAGLELVNIECKNSTFHEERLALRKYRVAIEWLRKLLLRRVIKLMICQVSEIQIRTNFSSQQRANNEE